MSKNTRYIVTGIHAVLGHAPGEEFSADIPDEQEAQLVAGGAIVRKFGDVPLIGKHIARRGEAPLRP